MVLACELIDEKASKIQEFPEDLLDVLKHIVLSHHGKLEYGSPKLPMMPEALVVAMVDDLDSKMNTLYHFRSEERRVGKECRYWRDWSSDVCSSDLWFWLANSSTRRRARSKNFPRIYWTYLSTLSYPITESLSMGRRSFR